MVIGGLMYTRSVAALVVFTLVVGSLVADERLPGTDDKLPSAMPQPTPTPMVIQPTYGEPPYAVAADTKCGGPCLRWLRNKGCWAHINSLGCGSLHSDLTFIFGSCRTFFGEPCLPGPCPGR